MRGKFKQKKPKHSIRRQFAWVFIALIVATISLCWIFNGMFLGKYYLHSKTKTLISAYESIKNAAESDSYEESWFASQLDSICTVSNTTIFVVDSNSQVKYVSDNGGMRLENELFLRIFGRNEEESQLIKEEDDYIIEKIKRGDMESLSMFGTVGTGISFILQTPMDSIKESASLANKFFLYSGTLVGILGGIAIWLITGKITKPIQQLNDISEKMVHLDFTSKYTGSSKNEIGMLGHNINLLSESLEEAIGELKTANNELQKDIEKKEQIDEMRKDFLANVSHELKTPIALIQGYAEGLTEGICDDPESMSFYCEVILEEASKMNTIVQKLLTLNQLEFGNDVVDMKPFDLAEMVSEYLQAAKLLAEQDGISVRVETDGCAMVWGDAFKIEEVITNFYSNAVHHCANEKLIEVSVKNMGKHTRVSVFNTGNPIPEESLPHLWEKFYKVDKARTREYGGSGVGLSIVKAIMDSMHGEYGVENCDNGVLFWFELENCEQ